MLTYIVNKNHTEKIKVLLFDLKENWHFKKTIDNVFEAYKKEHKKPNAICEVRTDDFHKNNSKRANLVCHGDFL